MKHTYYPALDGLRTIAVGIVLCAHGGVTYFRSGGVGVDIFFVLSGFLITTILITEQARSGGINFRNFYARRFLRLAPALVLCCALTAGIALGLGRAFPGTEIALALSYTTNWALALYNHQFAWLNHCWSLSIEEQFYMLWPLVILLLCRVVKSSRARAVVLVVGAAAIAIYRATRVGIYTDERINFGLDTRMDTLMTGAALACLVHSLPGGKFPDALGRFLGRFLAPVAFVGLFAVIHFVTWYSPWMGWIGYVLVGGAAVLVVADLVAGGHSLLAPVLAWRPLVFIGRISYGLYLYHLPIYFAVEILMPTAPWGLRFAVKLVVSLALAVISFFGVEQRFLRLKGRFEASPASSTKKP